MTTVYDCEGFDNYIASLNGAKGWSAAFSSMQPGRLGRGQAARLSVASGSRSRALASNYSTLVAGFAFYLTVSTVGTDFYTLQAAGANAVRLSRSAGGKLIVRNAGGTTIATGTTTINSAQWYYAEIKAVIAGASGTVEVHLDGNAAAPEIPSTTGNFGTTNLDSVLLSETSGENKDWDDMYWADDFLGDVEVFTAYPASDGANQDWTPDTAGAHYSRVNEHSSTFPDGDTTYVKSQTAGQRDTYGMDALPISSGTVFAAVVNAYSRKDDSGVRTAKAVIRQAGTNHDNATPIGLGLTYAFDRWVYNLDPTGGAWTISNANADEIGVRVD